MIQTRICNVLGIQFALGGLGGGHTQPAKVAAVSETGGFGALREVERYYVQGKKGEMPRSNDNF
jgi:hypothetical protein